MPIMQLTVYACILSISWFGAKMIVGQTGLTTGELTSLLSYVMNILMSLMMLSMVFVMVTQSAAAAQRIEEVLEEQPEITDDDAVKEITGDGLGAANDANWTYTQTYRDYRTDPDSPLDPMGVVISPMLDDYQHARYVRLRIHASYTNKTYNPTFRGWCIAELNVWGNNELLE